MRSTNVAGISVCLVLALLSFPAEMRAQAQDSPPPTAESSEEDGIYFESIDVNLVNIDVFVTDKKGKRVTGLTQDDFRLFEDGRPVEITNFFGVEAGVRTVPDPEPAQQAEASPRTPIPLLEAPSLPADQRLYLIIYFDNLFLRPFNRNKLIDEVRRFVLERLDREDRVMLVTSERAIHIRHPFTTDHRAILRELDSLRKLSAFGVQQRTERRDILHRIDAARDPGEALSHVDFYAKSVHNDLLQSINSLKEIVGSLAGLPGRKALLYVSDGIPMTPGEDLFFLVDQMSPDETTASMQATRYRARREFNELTARANANRISFYTVEAAGLTMHQSLSAEYGGRETSILEADVMRDSNREQPLMVMADKTGGLFALNTNNFDDAFDRISGDFRNYYSLGYIPAHVTTGRYYKLEVKVNRPGLRVRHRDGYRDKSTAARVDEGTLAALLHGAEKNPLGIRLETGTGSINDQGQYLVPLLVRIPLGNITLIPRGETHRGEIRVSVGLIDERGRTSPVTQTQVPIDIPNADVPIARRQDYVYEAELLVRPGSHTVAVGVRDDFAGDTSFVRHSTRAGRLTSSR